MIALNDPALRHEASELIYVCRMLRAKGLVNATHGNLSIRFGDLMYITPTGCDLESVREEDLVAMSIESGNVVSEGKPSKEWEMHLLAYRGHPEAGGIVHAHSPNSVALGCCCKTPVSDDLVPCYTLTFALFTKHLPMIDYYPAGSHDLAFHAACGLHEHNAVLLAHHGLITVAPTVRQAYYRLEEIEENCEIALKIGLHGRRALDPDKL